MEINAVNFVKYLNTIHRCNGNNKNTTAEANFNSQFFESILYKDQELINKIAKSLFSGDCKVLLTGFAGDGKTTLAQIILSDLKPDAKLTEPIQEFYIEKYQKKLVVIKDLSENSLDENNEIINRYFLNEGIALLIVSNTGAILNRLKLAYKLFDLNDEIEMEEKVLYGISNNKTNGFGEIKLKKINLNVLNLVSYDNIPTAKNILNKIIFNKAWDKTPEEVPNTHPILKNIETLKNEYVRNRLFLLYELLYEYGHRFTIRNFIEHFSYIITGNLDLLETVPNPCDYLFFNNVFGSFETQENIINKRISICNEISIISLIKKQQFGLNISPRWKRKIWSNLDSENELIFLFDKFYSKIYQNYLDKGYRKDDRNSRLKLYRLIYFLLEDKTIDYKFISTFLNSPGLELWRKIQIDTDGLKTIEKNELMDKLKHVIKENFSGIKLPMNGCKDQEVYITMNRNKKEVIQSAQVVISRFIWRKDDTVKLITKKDKRGKNQLELEFLNTKNKSNFLFLPLPFLDFLIRANSGNINENQFQYFQKRLDKLKNEIIKNSEENNSLSKNTLSLVRVKPNRELGNIKIRLINEDKKMEVE
ncbi:MAG: hypothetical protein WC162_00135 [Sphaerochaetaceae bacterium]